MTAFEILLHKFYVTIENNEPKVKIIKNSRAAGELKSVLRDLVNITFKNGHNLSYKKTINELMDKGALLLQSASHEDWARVRTVFQQNDLHYIRKDRNMNDVQNLKLRLERSL